MTVQKITIEKVNRYTYYVYLNKKEGGQAQMAEYFINSELAVNYADKLRSALIRQGMDVEAEIGTGVLNPH